MVRSIDFLFCFFERETEVGLNKQTCLSASFEKLIKEDSQVNAMYGVTFEPTNLTSFLRFWLTTNI